MVKLESCVHLLPSSEFVTVFVIQSSLCKLGWWGLHICETLLFHP